MGIRTILAAVSGGAATSGTIHLACQLARRFSAHVEGYHVMPDPVEALPPGDGIGIPPHIGLIETMLADAEAKAGGGHSSPTTDSVDDRMRKLIAIGGLLCQSFPTL